MLTSEGVNKGVKSVSTGC